MPSFPDSDQQCNPHLAALVAINIITEVVDEAQDILNTAKDSGQPWRYIWRQKKGNGEFYENAKNLGIVEGKSDGQEEKEYDINKIDTTHNIFVTSTPQKDTEHILKTYENSLIGQGDEDIQKRNDDLRSSSMLISCLFDISELEQSYNVEVSDDIQRPSDAQDMVANFITELVEYYVNVALDTVPKNALISDSQEAEDILESSDSSYSMLEDALITENKNGSIHFDSEYENNEDQNITAMKEKTVTIIDDAEMTKKDIDLYEKTFSTLNRDYEKYSDKVDFSTDQNNLTMQEVELPTRKYDENFPMYSEPPQVLTKEKESIVLAAGINSHKNSLIKRCRLQGARIMTRLRSWWWKQRLIGKRKGGRTGVSGICPLSPKARNRAASLLDHRELRSPSPSRVIAWKFNTVNESLIHSYNRKEVEAVSSGSVKEN